MEKPTHADPVRRFHLPLETIFRLPHTAKIELTLSAFARQGFFLYIIDTVLAGGITITYKL